MLSKDDRAFVLALQEKWNVDGIKQVGTTFLCSFLGTLSDWDTGTPGMIMS